MFSNKKNIKITFGADQYFEMVYIRGGFFDMGAASGALWEKPVHKVNVSSFYLSRFLVTQSLYNFIVNLHSAKFEGPHRPVEMISWEDAKRFIAILTEKTGYTFRLPSEVEWEYAAKGGKLSEGYKYGGSDELDQVGWYAGNSGEETKVVGLLLPNELGLYDMIGNVWEWCEDDYHDTYEGAPRISKAWIDRPGRSTGRVLRGGSYYNNHKRCFPWSRYWDRPNVRENDFGFRLAMSIS